MLIRKLLLLTCAFAAAVASAQVKQNPNNGQFYELVELEDELSWETAFQLAASRTHNGFQGYLATLVTEEENLWVQNTFNGIVWEAWIGGYQDLNAPDYEENAGGWRWITGEAWAYTNWAIDEPNGGIVENHLELQFFDDGTWNDEGFSNPNAFIVEYGVVPEPATLFALAGAVCMLYRRKATNVN